MPEKVSKAIKIVNPKTKEEVDPKGPSRPSSTTLPLTETVGGWVVVMIWMVMLVMG